MVRHHKYLGVLLAFGTSLLMAACSDNALTPTHPTPQGPNSTIFDGAHSGNKNVFFLPPIVPNPVNQPGYGGTPQSGLPVTYRIDCVGCGVNGKNTVVTTLTPTFNTDHYQANWDTKAQALDTSKTYRIEVRVGSQALAFADVDVVGSGSQLKKVDTQDFIALLDGRTLPINVRIQQGVTFCTSVNCASDIVPASTPVDQPYIVETADGLNGAAFRGQWNTANVPAIVTIQDITSQVSDGKTGCNLGLPTVKLTIEHCVRISTDPAVIVADDPAVDQIGQNTVVVNTCIANPGDVRQSLLKYDVSEAPIFLRDAPPPIACPLGYGSINPSRNPLLRFASRVGGFLSDVFGPKSAYAIDLGAGGAIDAGSGFSVFALGFPANLTPLAGDQQTTAAASAVPIDPQVQLLAAHVHTVIEVAEDVNPAAVANATITCTVTGGGGTIGGASSVTVATNAQGIATCPHWVLGAGANTLTVTAPGFGPNLFSLGVTAQPAQLSNSYTFTATGTQVATGTIQGTVQDATGAVIAGATVSALLGDGTPQTAITDSKGNYQITQLQPGVYNVSLVATGVNMPSQQATVTAGATTTVNFPPPSIP